MVQKVSCLFCASRCGLLLRVADGRLTRVEGDPEHPVSRGWSCHRGRAASAQRYRRSSGQGNTSL